MKKNIYAYARKTIEGIHFGASDLEALYNHLCVIKKKMLNQKEINILNKLRDKRIKLLKKEQEFLKGVFKE